MLDFLTTPYLWLGAAAAAIPIIVHLIFRNRAETVYFAAMRFLQATPKKLLRRQKLLQILLLALRILALLLLGLAFARPLLPGDRLAGFLGKEPRALAVIIDNSASMSAAGQFQAAVEAAEKIITEAGESDQLSVIAAAGKTELLAENANRAQAQAALAHARPSLSAGNAREAVQFADNLLRQSPIRRREIYFVSDLQATALAPGNLNLTSNAHLNPIPLGKTWQNVALLASDRIVREQQAAYACRVRNFAQVDQEVEVRLVLGRASGPPVAGKRIKLAASEEQTVHFNVAGSSLASNSAYFEIAAAVDDYQADNRFYLAADEERLRRVLLISGNPETEFYVSQALDLPGTPYRVVRATPNALEGLAFENIETVILAGAAGVNRAAAEKLRRYVEQGGGLIVALGARAPLEAFNHFLGEILPGRVLGPAEASSFRNGSLALAEVDFAHPVFKVFRDPANGDPSAIQVSLYYRVEPKPEAIRIAGFEDGNAALLELGVGRGKVLMWTSTLDLSGSNLPVRSIFVPVIHQWIDYVRRSEGQQAMTSVGQPIFLDEDWAGGDVFTILSPDGSEQVLPAASAKAFRETNFPGYYIFKQGRREFTRAVNVDGRESDPAQLVQEDFLARMQREDERGQIQSVFGVTAAPLQDQERQQKLWRFGLWVVLAILLGEAWLANRTPR